VGVPYATGVFDAQAALADQRVREIIAANQSGPSPAGAAASVKHPRAGHVARMHTVKRVAALRGGPL